MHPAKLQQANLRLRQERIQRNWRQRDLAEQLGTTELTIQRWERGSHYPSAYFRMKLCTLFGKSAEDLGLLASSAPSDGSAAEDLAAQRSAATIVRLPEALRWWNIPAPRNPFFTGREALLELLHTCLHPQQTAVATQAYGLWNLGGMGKTQVAIEYAYRYAQDYQAIFWMDAENDERLMAGIQQLADLLELPERMLSDHAQVVAAVQEWLAKHSGWLLIGDNLEESHLLDGLLLPVYQGAVLLTTRHSTCSPLVEPIELTPMTIEEGVTFLLRRTRVVPRLCEQVQPQSANFPVFSMLLQRNW